MATITKHRDERRLYGIDFAAELNGATISSVDLIQIFNAFNLDVTAHFRGASPVPASINGTRVDIWLEQATQADQQTAGKYKLKVRIVSSDGEQPIALSEPRKGLVIGLPQLVTLQVVGD